MVASASEQIMHAGFEKRLKPLLLKCCVDY